MVASIEQLSYPFQIAGFWFTVVGTALALAGLVWAIIAAKQAKGAREQAGEARDAAIRLGRVVQLGDLIGEMQELQTMLARADFGAVTSKSNQLRGRVVRFKEEAYTELVPVDNTPSAAEFGSGEGAIDSWRAVCDFGQWLLYRSAHALPCIRGRYQGVITMSTSASRGFGQDCQVVAEHGAADG